MADVLSVIADVLKQDKQQKREQNKMMREVQKKLKEKEVSEEEGDKDEYMKFFADTLKKFGVKSPAELSGEDKKKFFDAIDKGWKGDNEKPEPEDEETSLGKRVKARMEAEDEKEDEDEDPVGDGGEDTDVVAGGEPTEAELEKLADLVVQKIKDKADEEEEEEAEPEATEAESGKEEKIDVNPKMEQVRNPHARNTWEEALRQVYATEEKKNLDEAGDTSWIDPHARKVERKWKSMNKSARKKWLQTMADKAEDEDDALDAAVARSSANKAQAKGQVTANDAGAVGAGDAAMGVAAVENNHVSKIIFACDAGMGSSAMGASLMKKKVKEADLNISVTNSSIKNLQDEEGLLVITQKELTERATQYTPSAVHVSVDNFLGSPKYDEIVEKIRHQS